MIYDDDGGRMQQASYLLTASPATPYALTTADSAWWDVRCRTNDNTLITGLEPPQCIGGVLAFFALLSCFLEIPGKVTQVWKMPLALPLMTRPMMYKGPRTRVLTQGTSHVLERYESIVIFQRAEIGRLQRNPFCSPRSFIQQTMKSYQNMARSQ